MGGFTVEALKVKFPDVEWRKNFIDFCDLMELLSDCIIGDDYAPSDGLNDALKLSPAGQALFDKLVRHEEVKAKDARLMCALNLGHKDLFVDLATTSIDRLADAINAEMVEKRIRFPFTYGRDLYDAFADQHEEEKRSLNLDETMRLLDQLPPGVFQYGKFVVGPFGLTRSKTLRSLPADRRVKAWHCARTTCSALHSIDLQTSFSAPINRDRSKMSRLLDETPDEASEWWQFATDISGRSSAYFGDQRAGILLPLLGDALSSSELRKLVERLLDHTGGSFRSDIRQLKQVTDSTSFTNLLSRAELLQVLLLADERSIAEHLDNLILDGEVSIPQGDVRRTVTSGTARSGAFRLYAELGHYGVRFVSDDLGLALLRQKRLVEKLYARQEHADRDELEWQLRGIEVPDLEERLAHFLNSRNPAEVLSRLVLARRTNMLIACEEVGIDPENYPSDPELLATILWKLGFPPEPSDDPHADFWRRHQELWALVQSSNIGASARFKETAGPYFSGLEGLLADAIAFTSWALLNDHTIDSTPFSFDDETDRAKGLSLLDSFNAAHLGDIEPTFAKDQLHLDELIMSFKLLGRVLDAVAKSPEQFRRDAATIPEFEGKTDLKKFVFHSSVPFLDMSAPSQQRIRDGLELISSSMSRVNVSTVRNDYLHYRRNLPDISRVESALEGVRQAVTALENLGFCRLIFSLSDIVTDSWGQTRYNLRGPRGYRHTFIRPTALDWMNLPPLRKHQFLLRAASFGDPSEVLRFTPRYKSDFSDLWGDYPRRRRRGPGRGTDAGVPDEEAELL